MGNQSDAKPCLWIMLRKELTCLVYAALESQVDKSPQSWLNKNKRNYRKWKLILWARCTWMRLRAKKDFFKILITSWNKKLIRLWKRNAAKPKSTITIRLSVSSPKKSWKLLMTRVILSTALTNEATKLNSKSSNFFRFRRSRCIIKTQSSSLALQIRKWSNYRWSWGRPSYKPRFYHKTKNNWSENWKTQREIWVRESKCNLKLSLLMWLMIC